MTMKLPPIFSSETAREMWRGARDQAALLGAFDPIRLVGDINQENAIEALTALGDECFEIVSSNAHLWQLNADVRRKIIFTLADEGRLRAVADTALPIATDPFGRSLASAALGQLSIPVDASLDELGVIHNAVRFVASAKRDHRVSNGVDRAIARVQQREAIDWLLPHRLIGRDWHLRAMRAFAYGGTASRGTVDAMLLTGVGGAGKSALLAEFARRHHKRLDGEMPIVWMDFDRAALAACEPVTLTREFLRQIAVTLPEVNDFVAQFDRDIGTVFDERNLESSDTSVYLHQQSVIWSVLSKTGLAQTLSDRKIILILDTIEEVLIFDDGRFSGLIRWLRALTDDAGIGYVRPILSGRSSSRPIAFETGGMLRRLRVGALGRVSAARLLDAMLVDAQVPTGGVPSEALVEHYGGNPLTLRLMARYLGVHGPEAADELLEEAGERRFNTEFAAPEFYSRILKRIRSGDPDLAKLAYPGLVLRRVTPDLIRDVLAGPCGIGPIGPERAQALFDELARQIWLVDQTESPDVVRHRRDLRRVIFGAMNDGVATDIHAAAADYYAQGRDRWLTPQDQAIEARYHQLFLADPPEQDREALHTLGQALGEDIADLPIRYRARLKYQSGYRLADEEIEVLDRADAEVVESARERERLRRGAAIPESGRWPDNRGGSADGAAERAFRNGDLERVIDLGEAVIDNFVSGILLQGRKPQRVSHDLTEFSIWRVALAAYGHDRRVQLGQYLRAQIETAEYRAEWRRAYNPGRKLSLSMAEAVLCLLEMFGTQVPGFILDGLDDTMLEPAIRSIEGLRLLQLGRRHRASGLKRRRQIDIGLLQYAGSPVIALVRGDNPAGLDIGLEFDGVGALNEFLRSASLQRPRLADIAALYGRRVRVEALDGRSTSRWARALLRGVSPELYPPILSMALTLAPRRIAQFAGELERRAPHWPVELTEKQLGPALQRDAARWTGTLIETLDRFGELGNFLVFAGQGNTGPRAQMLIALLGSYSKQLISE